MALSEKESEGILKTTCINIQKLAVCAINKNRLPFKNTRGVNAAHIHYSPFQILCLGKAGKNYISPCKNVKLHSFKDRSAAQSVFVQFLPRNLSLYVCL